MSAPKTYREQAPEEIIREKNLALIDIKIQLEKLIDIVNLNLQKEFESKIIHRFEPLGLIQLKGKSPTDYDRIFLSGVSTGIKLMKNDLIQIQKNYEGFYQTGFQIQESIRIVLSNVNVMIEWLRSTTSCNDIHFEVITSGKPKDQDSNTFEFILKVLIENSEKIKI
jgi:hypothetical protein